MNKKKMLAVLAAATMMLSATPVSAGQIVTDSALDSTVTGSGTVNGVDMGAVLRVTLPTGNALNFTVDPYNLVDLGSGESTALDTSTGAGAIISASGSGAIMKNESSVPVQITVTFDVTDAKNKVKLVTDDADEVITSTDTAMFLAAIPSKVQAVTVASYQAADTVVPVEDGSTVSFKLDKAAYVVKSDGNGGFKMELEEKAGNFDATVFKLGGKVNKVGEWDEYDADDFYVSAVFEFTGLETTASDSAVQVCTDAYALVSGQSVVTDYKDAGPVKATGTYNSNQKSCWFATSEGDAISNDDVRSATVNGKTVSTWDFDGYVGIKRSEIVAVGEGSASKWVFKIVMNDGTIYTATVE